MVTVFVKNESSNVEHWALVCSLQEMQDDQQKQLKDMKENIGYYQKKAQELEVRCKEQYNTYMCTLYGINVYRHVISIELYLQYRLNSIRLLPPCYFILH